MICRVGLVMLGVARRARLMRPVAVIRPRFIFLVKSSQVKSSIINPIMQSSIKKAHCRNTKKKCEQKQRNIAAIQMREAAFDVALIVFQYRSGRGESGTPM